MEHDMTVRFPRAAILAVPFSLATFPAFAHHMMGGRTPSTFMEGLLSGFGHPVIGLDHFAFLVAIGIAVGIFGLNLLLPVAFIVAMAFGVLLHVNGAGLPGAELVVAASVLLAGGLIAWGRPLPVAAWGALFAIAGLFHGYSLGESIYGADRSTLGAYLLGLVIIQSVLTVGVALLTRRLDTKLSTLAPRLAGALILVVGVVVLVENL
jgi:urease accessory protein